MADTLAKPKVTQAQIDEIVDDFNELLDDVTAVLPHDSRVDTAIMFFKMAEGIILTVLRQHKA